MGFYLMDILNKKNVLLSFMLLIFASSFVFAHCGFCQVQNKTPIQKKPSSFITSIPNSGKLEGFVITSCGICNFGYKKNKGCSLTIKIGDTVYPVEGTSIHDHGDAHSEEGFCSAVRVAYVSGEIKKNKFYSEFFSIIESPN